MYTIIIRHNYERSNTNFITLAHKANWFIKLGFQQLNDGIEGKYNDIDQSWEDLLQN